MWIFNIFSKFFLLFQQIWNGGNDGNGNVVQNIHHNIANINNTIFAIIGNDGTTNIKSNNNGEPEQRQQQCGHSPYLDLLKATKDGQLKVINGDPVKDIRQFPWMVSLAVNLLPIPFLPRDFLCTGTIISRWHILTAGHCIGDYFFLHGHGYKNWPKFRTGDYLITAGVSNRTDVKSEGVQQIRSKWLIPHPKAAFTIDWSPGPDIDIPFQIVQTNDIAIIELSEPLNFTDKVQPICLPADDQSAFDKIGIVAGWGVINRNDIDHPDSQLHIGQMKIEQDACKNGSNNFVTQALCYGDSGGLMMVKMKIEPKKATREKTNYYWTQIGINSLGNGKYPCYAPSILTRTSFYCDWIANATGMKLCI